MNAFRAVRLHHSSNSSFTKDPLLEKIIFTLGKKDLRKNSSSTQQAEKMSVIFSPISAEMGTLSGGL